MPRKLTVEQVVLQFKEVHGDRYDYSKVDYKGNKQKVTIICKEHGEFKQTPIAHKRGAGCPKCAGTKKLTREEFILQSKEVHGDRYDYSKVDYKGNKQKVTIICKEHGEFEQTPYKHNSGRGCPKCGGSAKLTTEQIIVQFKEVHGDTYDYSKVDYKNNKTKVTIICKEHGEFEQTPGEHKKGAGCPKCAGTKKLTREEFISQSKEVHGDRYDYSKVDYKNVDTKVTIICKEHGEFEQIPYEHKKGAGCPICGGSAKLTTEQIIVQFKEVHGDTYDYSKVDYKNNKTKVTIICKEHGEFEQTPNSHKSGKGCPKCSGNARLSREEFILQSKEVHGDRYDYSKVDYKNAVTKVIIICKEHREFEQRPMEHKKGAGCPSCADSGFDPYAPAILYYLSINNGEAYKIGITNRTVEERFSISDRTKIKVIYTRPYALGIDARNEEGRILNEFNYAKYTGDNLLETGNSELFNYDVLLYDLIT